MNGKKPEMVGSSSSIAAEDDTVVVAVADEEENENAPLIGMCECRICQEEDSVNNLESPCACSGSLKKSITTSMYVPLRCSILIHPFVSGG
ncbi:hypothetical protein ACS0TY_036132 [Phlomoides rotata]